MKRPAAAGQTEKKVPKGRRSGRYKKGARKGKGDTRMSKKVEKELRDTISTLQAEIIALRARVEGLEKEVVEERNLRMEYEALEVERSGRFRRVYSDLRGGR